MSSVRRKRCADCGRVKPRKSFSTNRATATGLSGRCNACLSRFQKSPKWRAYVAGYYKARPEKRYQLFRRHCLNRKIALSLSVAEYVKLVSGAACSYCGGPLPSVGYGLDRKDNSRPYSKKNSVPCCGVCNRLKGGIFTFKEMLSIVGPAIRKVRKDRDASGGSLTSRDADPRSWRKKS